MTRAFLAVVNGAAGGGRSGKRAREALPALRAAGLEVDVTETRGPGDATRIAREAYAAGRRRFLAVGGDGTTYEVVNGLFPEAAGDGAVRLGILPLGTGNSFLRDFAITDADAAVRALLRAALADAGQPVDVIRVSHAAGFLHYVNVLSLGFSALVAALTNRHFKSLGAAGYAAAVIVGVVDLRHPVFPLRLDDLDAVDLRPCTLLSFSNSRCTGGAMQMAPQADPSDGRLDVIRVGAMSRRDLLRTFPKLYTGRHLDHPAVSHRRARRVTFVDPSPVDVMVDGEVLELELRSLEVLPGALQVLA
jgi:diacylglycerol kinase (ATP)